MVKLSPSINELMDTIVRISRFNKGEASKIFEEVAQSGIKFVMKNNRLVCVLVDVDKYQEMIEEINDLNILLEAGTRTREAIKIEEDLLSQEEVMQLHGIAEGELRNMDVEIE